MDDAAEALGERRIQGSGGRVGEEIVLSGANCQIYSSTPGKG